MNYKLIEKFVEIKEKNAVIENNSNGYVEFAIVNNENELVEYSSSNKLVEPNGKFQYSLEEGQKIFGRATNRLTAMINVFEAEGGASSEFDPTQYYTKTQTDNTFVKKSGNKVLSDNNYTTAEKEKLAGFEYATVNPLANGTASAGVSTKIAREDHVHPAQTTISGNAGTATKLQTARAIKLTGAVTGQANFDGSAEASISTTLSNLDGNKVNALTGYTKASESTAIAPTDSLLVALGKLEKGLEGVTPASVMSNQGNPFSFYYCTKLEYESLEKIQDDSTIYLVLDETTGIVEMKVYRP